MDDGQDGPSMKVAGPTWQGRVLHLETIIGESAELRVLKAPHSNADEWWFEVFLWLVPLDGGGQRCHH